MTREQMITHLTLLGWACFWLPGSAGMAQTWAQAPSGKMWFWWGARWNTSAWTLSELCGMGLTERLLSELADIEFMALTRLCEKTS